MNNLNTVIKGIALIGGAFAIIDAVKGIREEIETNKINKEKLKGRTVILRDGKWYAVKDEDIHK